MTATLTYGHFLTAMVLAFSAYASYTDIRWGKVRNLCSFGLIWVGLLVQLVYLLRHDVRLSVVLTTVLGGLAVAVLLYWIGILAPGDVKLFYGICLALPPQVFLYAERTNVFAPLILAVNTFVPYAFSLLAVLLWRSSGREALRVVVDGLRPKKLGTLILTLTIFVTFSSLVYKGLDWVGAFLPFRVTGFPALILVIVLFSMLRKRVTEWIPQITARLGVFGKRAYLYYPVLLLAGLAIYRFGAPWAFMRRLLSAVAFVYVLGRLMELASHVLDSETPIAEVEPGMILSEPILEYGTADGRVGYHIGMDLPDDSGAVSASIFANPGRLSDVSVEHLRELSEAGEFAACGDSVRIQRPVKFAPVMLVGVLITVFSGGFFYRWFL